MRRGDGEPVGLGVRRQGHGLIARVALLLGLR